MSDKVNLTRTQAAILIDSINDLLSADSPLSDTSKINVIRSMLDAAGILPLEKCNGEAHSNAHIDNCGVCAPRWGYIGPRIRVT